MDMQLLGDIYDVAQRMRERDYQEIICTTHAEDELQLSDYIAKNMVTITSDLFLEQRKGRIACFNTYIDGVGNVSFCDRQTRNYRQAADKACNKSYNTDT